MSVDLGSEPVLDVLRRCCQEELLPNDFIRRSASDAARSDSSVPAQRQRKKVEAVCESRCRSRRDCDDFGRRSSGADQQGRYSDRVPVRK
jgi:hypothetical protein